MYAFSYRSCRLAEGLSAPARLAFVSKFCLREVSSSKITTTTTTVLHQGTSPPQEQPARAFSLHDLRSSGSKQFNVQLQNIVNQSKGILQNVKLADLAAAPQPAFWYSVGGLAPFAAPVLSSLVFGYSPFLATAQLFYGATICGFLGGVKWGHTLVEKGGQEPSWENLGYAIMPQLVAWSGLLLPQALGFLFVSGGLLAAAYIDLTSPFYPPWFKALRLCLTIPAVFFLLLTCLMGLFH